MLLKKLGNLRITDSLVRNSSIVSSELAVTKLPVNAQWIAESAYYKALASYFMSDPDQDDWVEEKKIMRAYCLSNKEMA